MKRYSFTLLLIILLSFFPKSSSSAQTIPQLRTHYYPLVYTKEKVNIAIIGDSLVSGLHVSDIDYSFVNRLDLTDGINVKRFGARNLTHAVLLIDKIEEYSPDIILVEFGLNDISGFGGDAIDEEIWRDIYSLFVFRLKHITPSVYVMTTFNYGVEKSKQHRYNSSIRYVSEKQKVGLIDIYNETADCSECISRENQPSIFSPFYGDDFHPSDYGHLKIYQTIIKEIGL